MQFGKLINLKSAIGILYLILLFFITSINITQAESFADTAFSKLWATTDQAVANGQVQGSWLWGPTPNSSRYEPYVESPNGQRLVQYFDKSRMEINNPLADRNSSWFVTNGLLCRELVSGSIQTGDNSFEKRQPSTVPVGGDLDSQVGATYATFFSLASLNADRRVASKTGYVTNTIDRQGNISNNTGFPQKASYSYYEQTLGHNIPDVFYNWMVSSLAGRGVSWQYAIGLPITEPFWSHFKIGGVDREVLVQLFERRALTFNPSNSPDWQVEMGNIGLHYYVWRYTNSSTPTPTPTVTSVAGTPTSTATTTSTATATSTSTITVTPTVTPTPTVTTIPTPTATPTPTPIQDPLSDQWLARFNGYRAAAGLDPVTEDIQASQNDAKHVDYMLLNPDDFRHDEDPNRTGYTPEGQQAAKESNLWGGGGGAWPEKAAIDDWMESTYHRFGMLNSMLTRTGFAFKCNSQNCFSALNVIKFMNGSVKAGGIVYPGVGQQGVKTGVITWQFGPFDPAVTLVSATLKDGQGNVVPSHTEPANGYFNLVALKPDSALASGVTYTVEMKVTQNGQNYNKTWNFTTR